MLKITATKLQKLIRDGEVKLGTCWLCNSQNYNFKSETLFKCLECGRFFHHQQEIEILSNKRGK